MSVNRWRYTEACESRACPGDCDRCDYEDEWEDWEPDKKAIGDAIKAGEDVAGCRLVEKTSMIIK